MPCVVLYVHPLTPHFFSDLKILGPIFQTQSTDKPPPPQKKKEEEKNPGRRNKLMRGGGGVTLTQFFFSTYNFFGSIFQTQSRGTHRRKKHTHKKGCCSRFHIYITAFLPSFFSILFGVHKNCQGVLRTP